MVTIRCTRKLLRRVESSTSSPASNTLLGDWYANVLFARPEQLILCVSERTLLPVVITARPATAMGKRLAQALYQMLLHLGVSQCHAESECAKMSEAVFAPTRNRRVLGSHNDFMFHLSWNLHDHPDVSLLGASLRLAEIPCGPLKYASASELTLQLFANAQSHAVAH